jgi:hypothetical protein
MDIGAKRIDRRMHQDFGRAVALAFNLVTLGVDDNQVVGRHHAFADVGRRAENAILIEPHRDVAIVRRHPALLVNKLADADDVVAVFFFSFCHATGALIVAESAVIE